MVTSKIPSNQEFNISGVEHVSPEIAFSELQNSTAIIIDVREDRLNSFLWMECTIFQCPQ